MKKTLLALLAGTLFAFPNFANAKPAENVQPVCAMLKFTNDTRFDEMQPAEYLSDLVMERITNSKKFAIFQAETEWANKKTNTTHKSGWINENLEERLYNENIEEIEKFNSALQSDDYNEFFEDKFFNENKAQTIATAQVGQFITKEITQKISADNNDAEYLIQGTIINLGTGEWLPDDIDFIAGAVSNIAQMSSSQGGGVLGNILGALNYVGNVSVTIRGIGVQCDVRIIKASNGEVVWCKRVKGVGENKLVNSQFFNFGHTNMSEELYYKAMKKAADKIVDALIKDLDSGKLFSRNDSEMNDWLVSD